MEALFIGAGSGNFENPILVGFTDQRPRTFAGKAQEKIDPKTRFIDVTGTINGYDFQPNGTITFALTLTKRLE